MNAHKAPINRFVDWLERLRIDLPRWLRIMVALALVFAGVHQVEKRVARAKPAETTSRVQTERARLGDEVTVHAADRGNPYISLSDGHELITPYNGPPELTQLLERNQARPLSLCSADFDEDGVPDLMSGYAGPNGGIVTLLRGNVDSIYPNAPEAQQRRAEGAFTDAPFLSPAFVFAVPEATDFIGAGDFDGDGHWDVVTAARGSNKLHLMSGDGKGSLRQTKTIELPGGVTAMVIGEINRRDGLDELGVGVSDRQGSKALVFEGPEGALRATPETFELPAAATSLALGQLDDSYEMDLAIAAGNELMIMHGRDRKLSLEARQQADVKPAVIQSRIFSSRIQSIALGAFSENQSNEIALLLADGSIHCARLEQADGDAGEPTTRLKDSLIEGSRFGVSHLVSARVSSAPFDSLLVIDSGNHRLHIIGHNDKTEVTETEPFVLSTTSTSFDLASTATSILPMRLNEDALSDLVMLTSGRTAMTIANTRPLAAFVVTNANDSGIGSLRQAIMDANNSGGADTISFNIAGTGTRTINLLSPLPTVTGVVTIDGTTQPGYAGTPIVALRRPASGSTMQISAGSSVIRGLDICTARPSFQVSATDIEIINNGSNRIEGNVISESGIKTSTSNNVFGGTTAAGGNQFRDNPLSSNIVITGPPAIGNLIQGNSFLALPTCASLQSCGTAISLFHAPNSSIGGTLPQARNIVFGSPSTIDILIGESAGTVVQGNYIGINSTGSLGSGSMDGVSVTGTNVLIGGTVPTARNVISGHSGGGVVFFGDGTVDTNNLVQGNYIGTNVAGVAALGNRDGVVISRARRTTIGGSDAARNVISGNRFFGVSLVPFLGSFGCGILLDRDITNVDFPIVSNFIGTDAAGSGPLGNGSNGINIDVNAFSHEVRANRIAFNGRSGIALAESTLPFGDLPAFSIKILDNLIFANTVLGIDLGDDGLTQNDPRDVDTGANLRQNFPVLLSSFAPSGSTDLTVAANTTLSVTGTFNSTPNQMFTLQFFFGSGCSANGHQFVGSIPISLGSLSVATDANGNAPYNFTFDFPALQLSGFVNSTATDVNGNTSEISQCIAVTNPHPFLITSACKGDGKQLIINGSGFVDGAKVLINGEVEKKTMFISSTKVIAFKAGKRTFTGDILSVRNPGGVDSPGFSYTQHNCP